MEALAFSLQRFIKNFTKFRTNEQLNRAIETKNTIKKLNTATLKWLIETCKETLEEKKEGRF